MSDNHYTSKRKLLVFTVGWVSLIFTTILLSFDDPSNDNSSYRYPVDNIRSITGTFGELRSNHFHSGMDIRIGGRIGTPIYATQEGYVYRIRVGPYGFGRALYLRHADGKYSVYAHLSGFNREIQEKTYQRQLSTRQWEQEIFLKPNEIPVKPGELIGYGGNSGSSSGPHLHFEIRDPQERILNPMAYLKDELADHIAPIVREVAFEPLNDQARVQGAFEKYRVRPYRRGNTYFIPDIIYVDGQVGMEYYAYDLLDAARFRCGINFARLYLDQNLIHELDLKRFAFHETRYINQHIDYGLYQVEGIRFEKAYIDQGNNFSAYKRLPGKGIIELQDDDVHQLRLELEDYHGNVTLVRGNIQRRNDYTVDDSEVQYSDQPLINYDIYRNVLAFRVDCPAPEMKEGLTVINELGLEVILEPAYATQDALHFLYPLDSLMYPFAVLDHKNIVQFQFDFKHLVEAETATDYQDDKLKLSFPQGAVYQDVHLRILSEPSLMETIGNILYIGDPRIPIHRYSNLSIKIPDYVQDRSGLYIAYRDNDGEWGFAGNDQNQEGWISARIRDFGAYAIMADSMAPEVSPINFIAGTTLSSTQHTLRVKVKDDESGIVSKSIECTLDGQWLPFEYDYKNDQIIHRFRKRPAPGEYELLIRVQDEVGNEKVIGYRIVV